MSILLKLLNNTNLNNKNKLIKYKLRDYVKQKKELAPTSEVTKRLV